jgi:hypothetical protein
MELSYGEVNQEFTKVISTLARVISHYGKGSCQLLPPELDATARYSFVVSEFRHALGVTLTKLTRSQMIWLSVSQRQLRNANPTIVNLATSHPGSFPAKSTRSGNGSARTT